MTAKRATIPSATPEATPAIRGRKPKFRREDVIQAAMAIVAEGGHSALSMRAIAAHLGTGVATLYNYFQSLAEVNDALAIELLNGIPLPDATQPAEIRRQFITMVTLYADVVAL